MAAGPRPVGRVLEAWQVRHVASLAADRVRTREHELQMGSQIEKALVIVAPLAPKDGGESGDQQLAALGDSPVLVERGWVHLRRSNTEPIVRVYGEGENEAVITSLIEEVKAYFA